MRVDSAVGIGIIGCGLRLRTVLEHLPELGGAIQVAALADPDPRAVAQAREAFGETFRVYEDYRELVADPAVQWVCVGSWNCFHREHVNAALAAGKHVFCEKPLATNLDDCLAIYDAWQRSGLSFAFGFVLRYTRHYRQIRDLLGAGAIGELVSLEFNETLPPHHGAYIMAGWRADTQWAGTHLLEKCCHDIDIINWLVGSRVTRAASFGGLNVFKPAHAGLRTDLQRQPGGGAVYDLWLDENAADPFQAPKDIVDNQVAILEYANGVRASFHTNCHSTLPERRLYICGTRGALRADAVAGTIAVRSLDGAGQEVQIDTGPADGHYGGDEALRGDLARYFLGQGQPQVGVVEGLVAAATCFGIDEAHRTGRVVDLADIWARLPESLQQA